MNGAPIRIGVIGVGFGSTVQIPGFQSEGVEVTAVCARRPERAQEAADRFGIPHAFTDYEEMAKSEQVDAVSVVSPVNLHHPMTMAALNAGKHVLCEKPFALEQGQALEMLNRARETGVTAMITHEFRFTSGRMRTKELIEEGYLGPLNMALVKLANGPQRGFRPRPMTERDDAELGGGFLGALGSHYIDCLRHWFGEVTSASGRVFSHFPERTDPSGSVVQSTADDTFNFTLTFENGGWANMTGTNIASFGPGGSIEMYGRDGTLVTPHTGNGYNPPPHGTLLGAKPGDEALSQLPIPERLEPFADDRDDRLMPFRLLVREFVRGIREGNSPSPNFYDGYRCQQVLDAVRESSSTGRVVNIPLGDIQP